MVDRAGDPDVPVREGAETEGGAPGQCAGRVPQTLADRLRGPGSTGDAALFLVAYFLYIDGVGTILMMAAPISVDIGIPQGWRC